MPNPLSNARVYAGLDRSDASDAMTVQGTVNKTAFLLLLLIFSAAWTWKRSFAGGFDAAVPWMLAGVLGGVLSLAVVIFNKRRAAVMAPLYAGCEGLVLGGLSALMEAAYPGIALQAVGLTLCVLFALLTAYTAGIIAVTKRLYQVTALCTFAILMIYLATLVLAFFGIRMPYIHESGPIGIGFSLLVVTVAALNLLIDFEIIKAGAEEGAPRSMEWFGAMSLMVTLVWLYLEILRLLAKLRSRK